MNLISNIILPGFFLPQQCQVCRTLCREVVLAQLVEPALPSLTGSDFQENFSVCMGRVTWCKWTQSAWRRVFSYVPVFQGSTGYRGSPGHPGDEGGIVSKHSF